MKPIHLKIATLADGKGGQLRMWRATHVSKMRGALATSPSDAARAVLEVLGPMELVIQGYRCSNK